MILYSVIILVGEFAMSYLADFRDVYKIARKKWRAVIYDMGASAISWANGWIVYKMAEDWRLAILATIGSAIGTYFVANRKLKKVSDSKKKKYRRKMPFTTG